jgi:phage-related minor tail protein
MWKAVGIAIGAVVVGVPIAGYFAGRAETTRWHRYAPYVGLTYQDMRRVALQIEQRQGVTVGQANDVVELLACSSIPTAATFQSTANASAALVRAKGQSPHDAVVTMLGLHGKPRGLAEAALAPC